MAPAASYTRALLKLSGNAFGPDQGGGLDEEQIDFIAAELAQGYRACPQLAVVVGGGNIMRGAKFRPRGPDRIRADHAGMIATIVNALVLQDALLHAAVTCRVYSALPVAGVAAPFSVEQCGADLDENRVVILAGGTGNPLFTTDTAAALRAVQLGAQIMFKATRVEGVYSADPELDAGAQLHERLAYEDVLKGQLGVMDIGAVSLCMEHGLPVRVFNYRTKGNIRRALLGEPVGTLIGGA